MVSKLSTRTQKITTITVVLIGSCLFFYPSYALNHWLSPWDFGFLTHINTPITNNITNYIEYMHDASPFYIMFVKVFQSLFGSTSSWIAYPAILMAIPGMYAYLKESRPHIKWLTIMAALGGPVMNYLLFYSFRRDSFDLVLIFIFVLYAAEIDEYVDGIQYALVASGISLILWNSHYTIWPFFFIVALIYSLFGSIGQYMTLGKKIWRVGILLVSVPLGIYLLNTPLLIYFGGLKFITNTDLSLGSVLYGTHTNIDAALVLHPTAQTRPSPWYPKLWYIGVFLVIAVFVLLWLNVKQDFKVHTLTQREALLLSAIGSFLMWTPLLLFQGYFTRIFYVWPVMVVLLIGVLINYSDTVIYRQIELRHIITAGLVVILLINILMFIPYPVDDTTPTVQTRQASKFAGDYSRGPLYTGLIEANVIAIKTHFLRIKTPTVEKLSNGSVAVNDIGHQFYSQSISSGCILAPTSSKARLIGWGGSLPINKSSLPRGNKVYSNGNQIQLCST